jgi:hypothetical protein
MMKRNLVLIASSWMICLLAYQNCGRPFGSSQVATTQSSLSVSDPVAGLTCGESYSPGHTSIHRLTNTEYNNTVRDLLSTTKTPADSFPPTTKGASGYTNDSDAQQISDVLVSKYFASAMALAEDVIVSKSVAGGAYSKISPCGLTVTAANQLNCAQTTLRNLASKAYRRPVTEAVAGNELDQLLNIFKLGATFDEGLQNAITSILISPKFLFVAIVNPLSNSGGVAFALSDYEIAARLSYFLWQSIPDTILTQAAAAGKLNDPIEITAQVTRMLKDPKAVHFRRLLRDEWLGASELNNPIVNLSDAVRTSMIAETDHFLNDIILNEKPFSTIYSANYSYMNKTLADFYGVPFVGADPAQFVKTTYIDGQRLGIMSHGSFLTASGGMAAEASIVKRGKAVSAAVLCAPLGQPPVAVVDPNTDPTLSGNPRQRLIQVTSSSKCIGCHQTLNPLGFGLNMFSSFGQHRSVYSDSTDTIDTSGSIPGRISFTHGQDMLKQIAALDQTKACFAQQIMSIATTRAAKSSEDRCVQNVVGTTTSLATSKFSDTISAIVKSRQFRMQTGEAP